MNSYIAASFFRPLPVSVGFALESLLKYYRVERSQIAYLKFILEAYDGIAVLSTVDPGPGLVVLRIAPGCEADVEAVLEDLKKEILIEPAPGPPPAG